MSPLSKSKYMLGMQCPKLLWRTVHEPDAPELIPGPELRARFAHGHQVGALAQDRFPDAVLIPPRVTDVKAMMHTTTTAIDSGTNTVFEATFANEDARCAVDVLERREDGRWSVLEVKVTTKAKPQHVEDLAFQVWLAGEVGGLVAESMAEEVLFIRQTLDLSRGQLARALQVSFNTVARWERGTPPTGLHRSVLTALHRTAREVAADQAQAAVIRGLVMVGVAGLVVYALTRHAAG